ncbi:MAG: hypothetical protein HS116_03450 [Planctomycetes bacterium]|nr:hypothetical protein [Planctomycetota bacterium]
MLLVGVDEAGYGPVLGPLCHGLCVLRVPETASPAWHGDLWHRLAPSVSRMPAPPGTIAVDDSKLVHAGPRKRERLGLAVSAFFEAACGAPWDGKLETLLDAEDAEALAREPWGRAPAPPVEIPDGIKHAAALRACLAAGAVEVVHYRARALPAGAFNRDVERWGNKAEVNGRRAGALLRAAAGFARPGEAVHAVVDRLGGRKFYAPSLAASFDGALPRITEESKARSAYELDWDARRVAVEFREKADGASLPVALASMAAKLARELSMARFNAWFRTHAPELAPTAGYYTDAQRFLRETVALRAGLKLADADLIRAR